MHYAVSRAAGISVYGPPPLEVFGEVPRATILDYLDGELRWGLEHAPEAYAVLNACRAQVYLTDGRIVSKVAGAGIVRERGSGPDEVIASALAQHRGEVAARRPGPDATEFALTVAAGLRAAATAAGYLD